MQITFGIFTLTCIALAILASVNVKASSKDLDEWVRNTALIAATICAIVTCVLAIA